MRTGFGAIGLSMLVSALVGCGTSPGSTPAGTFTVNPTSDTGGAVGDTAGTAQDTGGTVDAGPVDTAPKDTLPPVDTQPTPDTAPPQDTAQPVEIEQDTAKPDTATEPDTGPLKGCSFEAFIGATGLECESGQTCVGNQGQCSGKVQGLCKVKVIQCPDIDKPVCGCNDSDYKNACEAQKAGVTVKYDGKCGGAPVACAGTTGVVCPKSFTCDVLLCDATAAGTCTAVPQGDCPVGGVPECGCDNKEYPNACYRLKAQVGRKNKGSCPTSGQDPCKIGPAGKPTKCPDNHFCKLHGNNPVDCTGDGECTPVPQVCDGSVAPVCGCDFNTYGNPCLMAKMSVSTKSAGKCGGGAGGCKEGQGTCPGGQYCGVPLGQCGVQGVCIPKPAASQCTPDVDLVCGCNGVTYSNAGCAAVAGVIVKSKGKCP